MWYDYYQSVLFVAFIDEQSGALMIRDYDVAMPALLCHKEPAQGKLKCRNIPDMGGIYCLMATYHAITTTWKPQNAHCASREVCCYGTSIVSLSRAITLKRAEVEKNTPKFCLKNAPAYIRMDRMNMRGEGVSCYVQLKMEFPLFPRLLWVCFHFFL